MGDPGFLELALEAGYRHRVHREFTFYTFCGAESTRNVEGGSLPKKTVPFERAVALVGDDALRRAGTSARGLSTAYSNWKTGRGVPWYIVGPLIEKRSGLGTGAASADGPDFAVTPATHTSLRRAPVPEPLRSAQDQLARIFFHFRPQSKQWRAILDVLALAAPEPERDEPTAQRRTRAAASRGTEPK